MDNNKYFIVFRVTHPGGESLSEDKADCELEEMIIYLSSKQVMAENVIEQAINADKERGFRANYGMFLICSCCGRQADPNMIIYDTFRDTYFLQGPRGLIQLPPKSEWSSEPPGREEGKMEE